MKKFIVLAALTLATPVFAQKTPVGKAYNAKVIKVTDGDTIQIEALWVPAPIKKQISVRIYGVDTPEKGFRAQCPAEDEKGQAASAFTKDLVAKAVKVRYILYDWDKYGGRVLGDMILDGKSLRTQLIANGYAREYFGDAKQSWCN
jgi:endonuclease YncB( thermonuclease family)